MLGNHKYIHIEKYFHLRKEGLDSMCWFMYTNVNQNTLQHFPQISLKL